MGRALMIGGVFLLSRDPAALAEWYRRYLGWELELLPDEGYYIELYFREHDRPERPQHLVFAIMPGDPGAGEGHIVNYRVDDVEAIVSALHADGIETSPITVGADAEGEGKFVRLRDPEGHRIELWEHLDGEKRTRKDSDGALTPSARRASPARGPRPSSRARRRSP